MSNKNNLLDNLKHIFIIRFIKAFSLLWWLCPVHFCVVRISEIPGPRVTTTEQASHSSAQLSPDAPAVNTPVSGGSARQPSLLLGDIESSELGVRQSESRIRDDRVEDSIEDRGQSKDRK